MNSCLCSKSVVIVATGNTESYWAMSFHGCSVWCVFCSPNPANLLQKFFTASAPRCKRLLGSVTRRYWAPALSGTAAGHNTRRSCRSPGPVLILGTHPLTTVKMVNILGPVLILGTPSPRMVKISGVYNSLIGSIQSDV